MSSRKRKVSLSSSEDGGAPPSPRPSAKPSKGGKKPPPYRSRLCSVPSCTKQVQQGGVCCKHGAKTVRAKCSALNCTNVAKRGGLCRKHGAFDLETCEKVGCKRVVKIKGGRFCEVHGGGSNVNATPASTTASPATAAKSKNKKKTIRAPKVCAYQGFTSRVRGGGGLCSIHHDAAAAVAQTEKIVIQQHEDPSYADDMMNLQSFCDEASNQASFVSHSDSCEEASEATQEVKEDRKLCDHGGCKNKAVYDGVCVSHCAMQRVYASNHRAESEDDSSASLEGHLHLREGTGGGGGDLADIGQLDFLCDYYEDMYEPLS